MTDANLQEENADLRRRLEEAEEVIRAIRTGTVDAFVVAESHGNRIYTLESADRPYRLLVEQMQQGAATLNADGAIAYCNRRFADLLRRPHEQLPGVALRNFIPPDGQALYESLLQQGGVGASQGEAHLQTADGGLVTVFLTFNALPPDCGAAVGVLVTDLTTQRHHEKLNAAVEALKEADRRKDEFLAMLSHELRNPLAPIRSALHLLRLHERPGGENPIQRQAREIIERQVGNMTKLVSDLLEVSRVVSGCIRLNQSMLDLNQVVTHAVETATPLIEQHQHELTLHLCPEPVWVNADATRMEEVFINLLNNAAKYTLDGGKIDVWCEHPRGENAAVFRIRDNGMGIDGKLLPRIFDLFTQADRSLARSAGGLGIGLTLAHRLVDLHGGTLEAKSPPEGAETGVVGSEFIVKLPLMAAPAGIGAKPVGVDEDGGINPDGIRVLVVDDNIDLVMMLSGSLRKKGYSVQIAHNGFDGLEIARQWRPDIVLLDIGLPGIDGYEVAERLRADTPLVGAKELKIIALTGYGRDTDIGQSLKSGFDAHIVKPYDFDELEKVMNPQVERIADSVAR